MMNKVLRYKKVLLGISILLCLVSIVVLFVFRLKPGIDFTSGSLWQVQIPGATAEELRSFISEDLKMGEVGVLSDESGDNFSITLKTLTDTERSQALSELKTKFGDGIIEQDFSSISPAVSRELSNKAWWAIGLVLLGISLYIAFAFRKVSHPVSSWKYGLITLFTLAHDVLIPAGVLSVLGAYYGISVDINFIVALLVVMGFSVHDTIVVFDRVRENLTKLGGRVSFEELIDKSIVQTIVRSINTSLTLFFVLISVYIWGPVNLKFFILTILVGTIAGAYSSIFVASPMLLFVNKKEQK
jgi:preprotein translocase subunit SecF